MLYKAEVIRRKMVSRLSIIINKFKTTSNYNNYLIQKLKLTFLNIQISISVCFVIEIFFLFLFLRYILVYFPAVPSYESFDIKFAFTSFVVHIPYFAEDRALCPSLVVYTAN